ncbi:uncharacterized protein LOC121419274 [Lytechinus variegatus]|uniref:uncharacterized protein LOC121419274 n=1 Tax=Lytechinus variegatus TaxID=7654 RepID=UPI001BB234CB|nr:uncharacterized protein LOC121419274 [Lytechinus variegatus]
MADDHRITVRTSRSVRSQLFGCHPACASNVWALMTAIALLGVGVYFVINSAGKFWIWVYLLVAGGIVLLLETMTLFTYTTCCRQRCGKCIKAIWFIDTWKRGLVYVVGGIFCFIPFGVDLRLLCGIMLFIAGFLYIAKTCKSTRNPEDRKELVEEEQQNQA